MKVMIIEKRFYFPGLVGMAFTDGSTVLDQIPCFPV